MAIPIVAAMSGYGSPAQAQRAPLPTGLCAGALRSASDPSPDEVSDAANALSQDAVSVDTAGQSQDTGEPVSDTFTAAQQRQLQQWIMEKLIEHDTRAHAPVRQLEMQQTILEDRLRLSQSQTATLFDQLQAMPTGSA
ncbi:hypothetical protein BV25DRAFT_1922746 [Artomyces pyxidatus]|uniref:Uncharacterized protein n=1 Tax=Artomyces pyxidatus TaxID=48021 RepID=A0ACB8SER3_9AGAM|nr:hypothetical protein BV25DRAFT_1922746 [Artomyces pyxidatus]